MKSKRLWTVEHWQVGDESSNLFELLKSRNLVADVELEFVLKDGIWEPDLQDDNKNSSMPSLLLHVTTLLSSQCLVWCGVKTGFCDGQQISAGGRRKLIEANPMDIEDGSPKEVYGRVPVWEIWGINVPKSWKLPRNMNRFCHILQN